MPMAAALLALIVYGVPALMHQDGAKTPPTPPTVDAKKDEGKKEEPKKDESKKGAEKDERKVAEGYHPAYASLIGGLGALAYLIAAAAGFVAKDDEGRERILKHFFENKVLWFFHV